MESSAKEPLEPFKPSRKVVILALRIAKGLNSIGAERLLSLRSLAREHNVSVTTVANAFALLREAGLIESKARSRSCIARQGAQSVRAAPQIRDAGSAAERVCRHIRDRITDGTLVAGEDLPKVKFYTLELHTSKRAVIAAFRILETEGVIHCRGKRRIAGREVHLPDRRQSLSPGCVLIIAKSRHAWKNLCNTSRTQRFGEAFTREAGRYGIRLELAISASGTESLVNVTGIDAVDRKLKELAGSCMGVLLTDSPSTIDQFDSWLLMLARHGKPVVWIDTNDQNCSGFHDSRFFTRCHYHEPPALVAALDVLRQFGHTKIRYIYVGHFQWEQYRLELLQSITARYDDFDFDSYGQLTREQWCTEREYLSALLTDILENGPLHIQRCLRSLVENNAAIVDRFMGLGMRNELWNDSPFEGISLYSQASDERCPEEIRKTYGKDIRNIWAAIALWPALTAGATAIIAPNDTLAVAHHQKWLKEFGLRIPADISLISFDNNPSYNFHSLTSVDFGFDYLGYQAFHAILNDIPTARGKDGDIPARPFVANQGSVGQARQAPLSF